MIYLKRRENSKINIDGTIQNKLTTNIVFLNRTIEEQNINIEKLSIEKGKLNAEFQKFIRESDNDIFDKNEEINELKSNVLAKNAQFQQMICEKHLNVQKLLCENSKLKLDLEKIESCKKLIVNC